MIIALFGFLGCGLIVYLAYSIAALSNKHLLRWFVLVVLFFILGVIVERAGLF